MAFRSPHWTHFEHWHHVLTLCFVIGVILVSLSLLEHPQALARITYLLYPCSMFVAKFIPRFRLPAACVAAATIVVGGVISPFELEIIEESFILVPLLFVMLFPGSLWPIPFAVAILGPYYLGTSPQDLPYFIEDGTELIVITVFAAFTAFFQQRSHRLMLAFREDSRTDYLTQLANRLAYSRALDEIDVLSCKAREHYVLLLLDLDGFKRVNDLFGHRYGDLLLREFARRMSKIEEIRLFRIGGDEFAVIFSSQQYVARHAEAVAMHILTSARLPYQIYDRELQVSVSIGIAFYDRQCESSEILSRNADLALYHAKDLGKNTFSIYQIELLKSRSTRDRLERELAQALPERQLFLQYQPKISLATGRICGVEALLRWQHPELGLISPLAFISLAEETRLIVPIGRWVLLEACWVAAQLRVAVSVNVSAVQLAHDNILAAVEDALEKSGLAAELLEIEITESSMMADVEQLIPVLKALRALGVQIAVDDFGVAYSSLSQLTRLPIDVLKIDKTFIERCLGAERDRMLVRTIIQLGHNLQLKIVAEGVETQAQHELLIEEGCQMVQGYWYARPLNEDDLQRRLLERC